MTDDSVTSSSTSPSGWEFGVDEEDTTGVSSSASEEVGSEEPLQEPTIDELKTCIRVLEYITTNFDEFTVNGKKILPTLPSVKRRFYGGIYNYLKNIGEKRATRIRNIRRYKRRRKKERKNVLQRADEKLRELAGMRQDRQSKRALSDFARIPFSFNCKDAKPALLPAEQPSLLPHNSSPLPKKGNELKTSDNVTVEESVPLQEFKIEQVCYICYATYRVLHHFYDTMCANCGDFNFAKRLQTADLTGKTAILTGGRVKIGFQMGLMLLRAGALVIVTTRFPKDAIRRYSQEPDFNEFQDRLNVYGLDLRVLSQINGFIQTVHARYEKLDIIINNAAQTVRRPAAFYAHLMDVERSTLPPALQAIHKLPQVAAVAARGGLVPAQSTEQADSTQTALAVIMDEDIVGYHSKALFPENMFDEHEQQVDLRDANSWTDAIGGIKPLEALECMLVNQWAPFTLVNQLMGLLERPGKTKEMRFIVNVSAMEGTFNWERKPTRHPQTNMAKAGLNMMTRTCGRDLARKGIFITSVDTGWISDEFPVGHERNRKNPPLDEIDGAARCLDPIFDALINKNPSWGVYLKNYKPINW